MLRHRLNPYGRGHLKAGPAAAVKEVNEAAGIVIGYFAAFSNVDSDGDYITPGAFAKTIAAWGPAGKNRIKHLFNHDRDQIIGVVRRLDEDDYGLRFESEIIDEVALKRYTKRALTEHSFAFDVLGWRRDEQRGANALTELRVYEGSAVTWGANMETPVIDIKGLVRDPEMLDDLMLQMKQFRRMLEPGAPVYDAHELADQAEQFEQVFAALKDTLREGPPAGTPAAEPWSKEEAMLHILSQLNAA